MKIGKWGDPVVYTDKQNNVEDSKKICKDHDEVYGQGGLENKNTYENIDKAWTDPKESKEAHIFHGYGNVTYSDQQIQNLENTTISNPNLDNELQNITKRDGKIPETTKKVHIVPPSNP